MKKLINKSFEELPDFLQSAIKKDAKEFGVSEKKVYNFLKETPKTTIKKMTLGQIIDKLGKK